MEFDEYQEHAVETDQNSTGAETKGLMIPMLGLAGEAGGLLGEFKKKVRDGDAYSTFEDRAEEELGDVLWYLANVASRLNLSLGRIASKNLIKVQERWPLPDEGTTVDILFDEPFPEDEQFPRKMNIQVFEPEKGMSAKMVLKPGDKELGEVLTNNAYHDDNYRFHDALHMGHLAILGWSPVLRALMDKKRRSNSLIDEVEDGARAIILEEAIIAFVYSFAKDRDYYSSVRQVDTDMLMTIRRLVAHLEVSKKKPKDWERAILEGYRLFRHLIKHKSGNFELDLANQRVNILS